MSEPEEKAVLEGIQAGVELPPEVNSLPKDTQVMLSVMAGFFRSTSGPDPETARIMMQGEMHEESCKLQAFQNALTTRDAQSARDHEFRTRKLNHETWKSFIITGVAVAGIICAMCVILVKNNTAFGVPLLVGCFLSLGIKIPGTRDKE